MHLPGAQQISAAKAWLERQGWSELSPHFTWVAWAEAKAEVAPAAIGQNDGPRIFYMLESKPVALHQLEPGRTYAVTHFDPAEARESDGGTLTADDRGEARLSAPQHNHDWVLLLRPAAGKDRGGTWVEVPQ